MAFHVRQGRAVSGPRERGDRCPGVARPWPAADGLLVRLRLVGGRIQAQALRELARVARDFGDGRVHVTSRANLQVRGLPGENGTLNPLARAALEATGLLPSPSHELVRNIMASPQTGLAGGRADLRPVTEALDRAVCATPVLSHLAGRFLFTLDDGRGDILDRPADLSAVALTTQRAQLRAGPNWGPVVPLPDVPAELTRLAADFARRRGNGESAFWHVRELPEPLIEPQPPHPTLPEPASPLTFGPVPGGRHVPVPEAGLTGEEVAALTRDTDHVIVTPWRGVLVPQRGASHATA